MSTSDNRNTVLRYAAGNLGFSAFCGFFAAVYEHFSFGVWSMAMLFSFAPCLVSGLVLVLTALHGRGGSGRFLQLFTAAAVTLAVGMVTAGVVEIYGTENRLTFVYPIAGAVLLMLSLVPRSQKVYN